MSNKDLKQFTIEEVQQVRVRCTVVRRWLTRMHGTHWQHNTDGDLVSDATAARQPYIIGRSSHTPPPNPTQPFSFAVDRRRRKSLRPLPLRQPPPGRTRRPRRRRRRGPGRDRGVLRPPSPRSPRTTAVRASPDRRPTGREERHHRSARRRSQRRAIRRADLPLQGLPQPVLHRGALHAPPGAFLVCPVVIFFIFSFFIFLMVFGAFIIVWERNLLWGWWK